MIMKTLLFILGLLWMSSAVHAQEDSINASLAKDYVGEIKMVCGKIQQARLKDISKDEANVLYTGPSYEDRTLALVFTKRVLKRFPYNPNSKMINHKFCIKGKIVMYKGKPAIYVVDEEQLNVAE